MADKKEKVNRKVLELEVGLTRGLYDALSAVGIRVPLLDQKLVEKEHELYKLVTKHE